MEKNEKIYVAGHTGMVGSSILRQLTNKGFTNIITKTHADLDLTNQEQTLAFFEKETPEYVFLTASKVGGIKANMEYMADFLIENLSIQINVLKMAHQFGVKKLLFTASSCIYPKDCRQPMDETLLLTDLLEPTNEGYALAKITGLKACSYYNKQYGTKFITAMPANAYGIHDSFDINHSHVIPAMIQRFYNAKLKQDKEVTVWGTGQAKREFLYVDDLADACIFLMNHYEEDNFINVGTGEEISMGELAELIKGIVGYEGNIYYDSSKPDGMMRRVLNSARIHELGWEHRVGIMEGIQREYAWYLQQL